jgi:hypothetical protein
MEDGGARSLAHVLKMSDGPGHLDGQPGDPVRPGMRDKMAGATGGLLAFSGGVVFFTILAIWSFLLIGLPMDGNYAERHDAWEQEWIRPGGVTVRESPDFHDWQDIVGRPGLLSWGHSVRYASTIAGVPD